MGKISLRSYTYLLKLLAAEYLRETKSIFISHLFFFLFCSLDALKKASKKKDKRIKMGIVKVLHKLATVERDRDDEILGFDLVFVA